MTGDPLTRVLLNKYEFHNQNKKHGVSPCMIELQRSYRREAINVAYVEYFLLVTKISGVLEVADLEFLEVDS